MLTLIWNPPTPRPSCAALCITSFLFVTRVSSSFTSLHRVKGSTFSASAGRMGSWAAVLCYLRLSLSPGPCLVLWKDLLCWDTSLCHAVLWHWGDELYIYLLHCSQGQWIMMAAAQFSSVERDPCEVRRCRMFIFTEIGFCLWFHPTPCWTVDWGRWGRLVMVLSNSAADWPSVRLDRKYVLHQWWSAPMCPRGRCDCRYCAEINRSDVVRKEFWVKLEATYFISLGWVIMDDQILLC